jgi:hypothetical protein
MCIKEKMLINEKNLISALKSFKKNTPFDHCIVDNFLNLEILDFIVKEFPDYNDNIWYVYDNPLEHKKALNNWNNFPPNTYKLFEYLVSSQFTSLLSRELDFNLYPDPGLHGGGWHIHGNSGNLNPHLDYSIHPKSELMRKLNIIIYISPDLKSEYGGHLGFWSQIDGNPHSLSLAKEIEPMFNRAVIFDTTQNSWHGMSRKLLVPNGVTRKSLAVYYLTAPEFDCDPRSKALYAPRADQIGDKNIEDLISKRADQKSFSDFYRSK